MTFKDLARFVSNNLAQNHSHIYNNTAISHLSVPTPAVIERFMDLSFWLGWADDCSPTKHRDSYINTQGNCCFNHVIGLPQKNGKEYPLFDYEKLIIDTIEKNQHIWVKKSRGIGVTELILRYLAWSCLSSYKLYNKSIFLISGTREEFSNNIKVRLEKLFERNFPNIRFESKYTELWLNKTWIKVFPTKRIQDLRGYTDVSYLFIDEADFFDPAEQWELEYVIKAYEEKSKCKILMTSTPYKPGGLFEKIERNEIFKGFFKKIFLDYTYGLEKIYDSDFIEREKNEAYFEREYNLKYLGVIGNVFHEKDIQKAIESGKTYDPDDLSNKDFDSSSMGLDCGFGSSAFGIVITRFSNEKEKIQIMYADQFERPDYNEMLSKVASLIFDYNPTKIYVDGANPAFIKSLKIQLGDRGLYQPEYDKFLEYSRKFNRPLEDYMRVIPIMFDREHKNMLSHSKLILEKGYIEINPKFDKLATALRTAVEKGEGDLDKEQTSYDDIFDAYRLALRYYKIESSK